MDQLAAHLRRDGGAGHGMVARDVTHRDRRADAGGEAARRHDADLVLAVEQLGALAHRQLAVDGEDEIGVVTSGGFAPSVGAPIAMGYVPRDHAVPGTAVAAEVRGKLVHCTVTAMPFIPHRYVRKQGA